MGKWGLGLPPLGPTHLRCDLVFFLFVFLVSWGFIIWAGWISHFQGSRGGNDTRLHCLGTVAISGFVFILSCVHHPSLLFILVIFSGYGFPYFPVYRFYIGLRMGDTRYSLLSCHGYSGWLGLVASETMCLRSCFLFELDILGVSRGFFWASPRPYVENGLYVILIVFFLSLIASVTSPLEGSTRSKS